jgi:hypothetical protein
MNEIPKRDFASLLDELLVDSQMDDHVAPRVSVPFDYAAVADELLSGRIKVASQTVEAEYREAGATLDARLDELFRAAEVEAESQTAAAEMPSTDPAVISRELGIKAGMPASQLARMRRAFAFRNHPDRVAPQLRQCAMVRMQVANMLIDDACRRAPGAARR